MHLTAHPAFSRVELPSQELKELRTLGIRTFADADLYEAENRRAGGARLPPSDQVRVHLGIEPLLTEYE